MKSSPNYPGSFDPHNEQWYTSLYQELFLPLIYYSNRIVQDEIEAEDIVAGCFIKLKQLLTTAPQNFHSSHHVKNFLYTMVKNASIDYRRSGKAGFMINTDFEQLENMNTEELVTVLEKRDLYKKVCDKIEQLPPVSRDILRLFLLEERDTKEVAKILGQSEENIRQAKYRALKLLRNMLKNKEQPVSPDTLLLLFWIYLFAY